MNVLNSSTSFGLPQKSGEVDLPLKDFEAIQNFIESPIWLSPEPVLDSDLQDSLLKNLSSGGDFMMGFDFHLTPEGPKLIEINTNAGGFATFVALAQSEPEFNIRKQIFIQAVKSDFLGLENFGQKNLMIVDEDLPNQKLFPEMQAFATWLNTCGQKTQVCDLNELDFKTDGVFLKNQRVDFVYNRLTDFRLQNSQTQKLRDAILKSHLQISPHPALYVRSADKRRLLNLDSPLNPKCFLLRNENRESVWGDRKHFVFKPATGAGSKGVYRGDKITRGKFAALPDETFVQELIEPARAADGSKYDVRIFSSGTKILGLVARHYSGQVMEMSSELSGFGNVRLV